jgi:hypothetical protein
LARREAYSRSALERILNAAASSATREFDGGGSNSAIDSTTRVGVYG